MKRTRKIAKILLLASLGLLAVWILVIHIIAPPYKYKSMYMFLVYTLRFGHDVSDEPSLYLSVDESKGYIIGPPSPSYTGASKAWFRNGNIAQVEHYVNGIPHGNFQSYESSGKLSQIIEFKNGKVHGEISQYDETGHLFTKTYLHQGYQLVCLRFNSSRPDNTKPYITYYVSPPRFEMDFCNYQIYPMVHLTSTAPFSSELYPFCFLKALDLAYDPQRGWDPKHYPHAPKGEQTILELFKTRLAQIPLTTTVGKYSYESNVVTASISPEEQAFKKPSSKRKDEHVISRTIEHEGMPLVSFLVDGKGTGHPYIHINAQEPETAYSHELLGILYYISRIDIYEPPAPVESATPSEPVQVNPHPDATTGS